MLDCFEQMGCVLRTAPGSICLTAPKRLRAFGQVRTMPYPGFPTDAQSPLMAVAAVCTGTTVFVENIFESRYKHVDELARMGANIQTQGRVAVVSGMPQLHSAAVQCTDLRGGAAVCVAALAANGTSRVNQLHHIDRGYEKFAENLHALGAKIVRSEEQS